ncbi:uncharacterized protein DFL_002009 [Arthrobotrys flagrans]|uniref:Clr5 domain-containing protein n=1 Tax=Arthrobotrys flagrans TaxID=97331 RepID=A0A437A9A3_ARTFL|nr:hypothetical protein DFL_002009 [Arthrobotrys flagrans]
MSSGAAVFNSRYSRAVLSKSDWEDHREFIQKHYIENDKTLEDLKVLLKENLGVEVTKHQLEYRCRRWNFRKNYSQAYPRQSQNQNVLKFPPTEVAKKGRVKQKASCEPQLSPIRQKPPASNVNGLSSYPALLDYDDRLAGAPKQAEIYSTTQETSYDYWRSVRGQDERFDTRHVRHEVDEYKPLIDSHDHQPLFSSSPGFDPVEYSGHKRSPLDQSFETSRELQHEQRDYKNNYWLQRFSQEYPNANTNNKLRNELLPYLDTGFNTWPLSAPPYQLYDSSSMNSPWDDTQLDPNVCAAPLSHQRQGNFESSFLPNARYMESGNTPRRSGFGYPDTTTEEWNGR